MSSRESAAQPGLGTVAVSSEDGEHSSVLSEGSWKMKEQVSIYFKTVS